MLKLLGKDKAPLGLLVNCKDILIESDLKTGLKNLSFSFSLADVLTSKIESECYIQTQDYEFIVKEINKESNDWFSVYCVANIETLTGKPHLNFEAKESKIADTLRLAIAGSGWAVEEVAAINKRRTIRKEVGSTLDIINDCAKVFMVDLEIDTLNRKIKIYEKRGTDKGAYFTNQLNLKKLTEQSNSYDFITRIVPIGKDDLRITDINGGKDYLDNFQYSNKVVAQYWIDKRYTDVNSLKEDAIAKLAEFSKPKKSYSAEVIMFNSNIELGDTITLVDNIKEIKEKQRVVKIKEYPLTPEKNTIEIANRTLSFTEQQQALDAAAQIVGDITTDSGAIDGNKIEGLPEIDMTIPDGSITADKLAANSVTTDKLAANSVTAGKIQAGSIDATHIKAGTITANSAIIDNAAITTAKIADASITNAKIADAAIDSAKIDKAQINSAHIQDAAIGTAKIDDAAITNAKIGNLAVDTAQIKDAAITNAKIKDLSAEKITAGDISADRITTGVINAINANIGSATINSAKIGDLSADKITTGTLNANRIAAGSIDASKLMITDLTNYATTKENSTYFSGEGSTQLVPTYYLKNSTQITLTNKLYDIQGGEEFLVKCKIFTLVKGTNPPFLGITWRDADNKIVSSSSTQIIGTVEGQYVDYVGNMKVPTKPVQGAYCDIKIQTSNSENHFIGLNISRKSNGQLIVDGSITAEKIAAGSIVADNISTGAITADKVAAGAIGADKIGANAITTDKLAANSVTTEKIKAGAIVADKISADAINTISLGASKITADDIEAGKIKVGNINIVDGTISGAKISSASITNAQIADATIESAKIKDLNASKINAGTIDATKVSINSTSGALSLADNTLTIKDTAKKTRVQVGKDSRNKYGILVMNADGEAIFDSDLGVLSDKGLSDGVVSTDKIKDEAVGSNKLNVDELFVGENAFINSLKAVEIRAENITTGTISNERINLKGMISFESFNEDIQHVFDVQGDKTYINGGMIATNTIKADKIDLLSGLTVQGPDKTTTFAIKSDGNVEVNGLLQSGNFDENKSTGYRIAPDGTAILNQARVSGEFVMPNAGVTNYGATIGNENLVLNSNVEVDTSGWILWNSNTYFGKCNINDYKGGGLYFGEKIPNQEPNNTVGVLTPAFTLKANEVYTLSFVAGSYTNRLNLNYVYIMNGSDTGNQKVEVGDISNFDFYDNTRLPGNSAYNCHLVKVTFTAGKDTDAAKVLIGFIAGNVEKTERVWIRNVKVEAGDKATPWCPASAEQLDYTRIWAGSNYETRDSAPFRVTQKGDVFATNATLSGRLIGDYDNDKIHIHNNEIVINDTKTLIMPHGEVMNMAPFDASPTAHIHLAAGQSQLNTDVVFGNNSDKRIEYSNLNRLFNFNNTDFSIRSNSGTTNLFFGAKEDNGVFSGLNLMSNYKNGHHVLRHSTSGSLVLDSEGSQGDTEDFKFTRKNSGEDVKVNIEGELKVKTKVSTTENKIEQRMASDGWGWYSI